MRPNKAVANHRWYLKHRAQKREYNRRYWLANVEVLAKKHKKWLAANPLPAAYHRAKRAEVREKILVMYGRVCACCGEDQKEFLALDHINGGGLKHRRELSSNNSTTLYRAVLKEGYRPDKYRILCHNCNMAVGLFGLCPHQRKKRCANS